MPLILKDFGLKHIFLSFHCFFLTWQKPLDSLRPLENTDTIHTLSDSSTFLLNAYTVFLLAWQLRMLLLVTTMFLLFKSWSILPWKCLCPVVSSVISVQLNNCPIRAEMSWDVFPWAAPLYKQGTLTIFFLFTHCLFNFYFYHFDYIFVHLKNFNINLHLNLKWKKVISSL